MAAQKGNVIRIKRSDGAGGFNDTIAGLRTKTLRINNNRIDITSDDDINAAGVSWRTFMAGIVDFEVTGDGVAKDNSVKKTLIDDALKGTAVDYQMTIDNIGTFEGKFIVNLEFSGNFDDSLQFSGTWSANEALTFTPA